MHPRIIYKDGFVKILYQYQGHRFRKSKSITNKSKSLNSKNGKLKTKVHDYASKQLTIDSYY